METAARGATTSPPSRSAVLSMPPVNRVGRIGPFMLPDGRGGCDSCGGSMPGVTRRASPGAPTQGRGRPPSSIAVDPPGATSLPSLQKDVLQIENDGLGHPAAQMLLSAERCGGGGDM